MGIDNWNKDDSFKADTYKRFKIETTKYGKIYVKPYYILELEYMDETWGIYFPNYELPAFECITGLKAE